MKVQILEKKETNESWISCCRLATKGPGKGTEVLERVRVGMEKETKVAKVAEARIRGERVHGRKAVARKEAKGKSTVAWETAEHVGLVVKQYPLQRGVEKEETKSCLMKMTVKTLKKHLTMMRSCNRGVCWKNVTLSSGKR